MIMCNCGDQYGRPAKVVEDEEVPRGNEKAFEELEAWHLSNNIQRITVFKSTHFQNNIRSSKLSAECWWWWWMWSLLSWWWHPLTNDFAGQSAMADVLWPGWMNACRTEGRRWRTVKAVVTATFPLRKARSSCTSGKYRTVWWPLYRQVQIRNGVWPILIRFHLTYPLTHLTYPPSWSSQKSKSQDRDRQVRQLGVPSSTKSAVFLNIMLEFFFMDFLKSYNHTKSAT